MAVFRWRQSWSTLHDLERELDRMLDSIKLPFPHLRVERQYPPVNLYDLLEEYMVVAELPGVNPDELDLTVTGGLLTLRGERRGPEGVGDDRFRRSERLRGTWKRQFPLPERVDEERVSAEFNHGVLKIHLPKFPTLKSRQIPISDGNPS